MTRPWAKWPSTSPHQAKVPHRWEFNHDMVGYNYRMPNINAALGCAQLEQLPAFVEQKRALAARYARAFENVQGVTFVTEPDYAKSNYWLNCILLDQDDKAVRDEVLGYLNDNGIMSRPAWTLMHKLPMFQDCPKMDLSVSRSLENRLLNIPSSAGL